MMDGNSVGLLGYMMEELIAAGVEISLSPEKNIESSGGKISGAFSDIGLTLEVATGSDEWFYIFAHEFCQVIIGD